MEQKTKKLILSASLILSFVIYVMQQHAGPDEEVSSNQTIPTNDTGSNSNNTSNSNSNSSTGSQPSNNNSTMPMHNNGMMGIYKDGTYTGTTYNAYYGNVQVSVSIQNGLISDIQFLRYPNDRSQSAYISSVATPYLKQEAIQAQSANVNIVSGATMTSMAFMKSLNSALNQAK